MKKLRIIANKRAGNHAAVKIIQQARQKLWGWDVEFKFPESLEEIKIFCEELDPEVYEAVILVGGDGTFNKALQVLVKKNIPIALYPSGTANDLARERGLLPNWNQIQTLIDKKLYSPMDLIRVNDSYFATVGGVGLGAALTHKVNRLRARSLAFRKVWKWTRSHVYSLLAAQTILAGKSFAQRVKISSNDFKLHVPVSSLLICNQKRLGGDMTVAPKAKTDDAKFDVIILSVEDRLAILRAVRDSIKGSGFPANHRFSATKCVVESLDGKPILAFGDGEPLLSAKKLEFELCPNAIKIYRQTNDIK